METIVSSREYDYFERQKLIQELCKNYGFVKKNIIGRSCLGRDITAMKIGSASEYCLIAAAFHGSERITSTILLMFIEDLCNALKHDKSIEGINIKKAFYGRGVIFVPCVNPDGCDMSFKGAKAVSLINSAIGQMCKNDFTHWNANARGVDINHNFKADWENLRKTERNMGIYGPGPTRFGGYKPESEPETIALTELCKTVSIRHALAFHSQGEVIYWDFNGMQPPRAKKMAEIMATSSGYALDTPIGIAHGGGFKDWFISEFNRPGFTVELGKGTNPLPAEIAHEIYDRVREMLVLSIIM